MILFVFKMCLTQFMYKSDRWHHGYLYKIPHLHYGSFDYLKTQHRSNICINLAKYCENDSQSQNITLFFAPSSSTQNHVAADASEQDQKLKKKRILISLNMLFNWGFIYIYIYNENSLYIRLKIIIIAYLMRIHIERNQRKK
jgi:hypothetical protein